MIAGLVEAMRSRLAARRILASLSYGDDRLERTLPQSGAIEIDFADGPDVYAPSLAARETLGVPGSMQVTTSVQIEVRCASSKAGARHRDHRRLARLVVDTLLLEAGLWVRQQRCQLLGAAGGFIDPPDTQQQHGATYGLTLDIVRGVGVVTQDEIDGILIDGSEHALEPSGTVTMRIGEALTGVVCEPPAT
jgi:hypothetical protein